MNEMLDRRRRLIKYTFKKEREALVGEGSEMASNDALEGAYKETVNKKNSVVTRFSSA